MRKLTSIWNAMPKGQQLLLVLLATFIVLPFVVLLFLQVYNAYTLTQLGNDIALKQNEWKQRAASLNANVAPEGLKSSANQFAYQLLETHKDLVAERRLVVTIQQPIGELRAKSGKLRTADELLSDANDRIAVIGEEECRTLMDTLAGQCTVMSATGRAIGENAFEYQIQLAFAEKSPLGPVNPHALYEFLVTRSSPGKTATMSRVYFEKAAAMRRLIYSDVAATCAAIRKKSGTCSVTSLSVASKLDRGTPMVRLAASAAYASLVPIQDITASTR
jgi:cell division protein FtsB